MYTEHSGVWVGRGFDERDHERARLWNKEAHHGDRLIRVNRVQKGPYNMKSTSDTEMLEHTCANTEDPETSGV